MIQPDKVLHMCKQRLPFLFDLFVHAFLRVKPAPIIELIEKVHAALLNFTGHLVKVLPDAIVNLLLTESPNLRRQCFKLLINLVHVQTLPYNLDALAHTSFRPARTSSIRPLIQDTSI